MLFHKRFLIFVKYNGAPMTKKRIGFIGLGLMGTAMATRFQKSGYPLTIYNRTRSKSEPLVAAGAEWADNPGEVARMSDIVFTMLSTSDVLKEIALGARGIMSGLEKSAVHIDCSTVSPAVTRELEEIYASRDRVFLHCPVLGSVPQAIDGTLLLLIGGNAETVERIEPVVKTLGSKIWKFKNAADASHAKLLCNLFIAGAITTLCQALVFAEKASVPPQTLLDIISNSALNSATYQTKGKSILEGNFAPRFFTEHMLKDVTLMLEAAAQKGVKLPTIEIAQLLLAKAVESGFGREDYSSVVKIFRELSLHS